jgi:hypothetical protein
MKLRGALYDHAAMIIVAGDLFPLVRSRHRRQLLRRDDVAGDGDDTPLQAWCCVAGVAVGCDHHLIGIDRAASRFKPPARAVSLDPAHWRLAANRDGSASSRRHCCVTHP